MVMVGRLVDDAWEIIEPNLDGLTDAEYFWEPTPGAWNVRRRDEVRSPDAWGRGGWAVEHCFDGSHSPPTSTIGWRLMHAYDCTTDFTSRAFGHGGRDWNDIEVAGDAATAVTMMSDAVTTLRRELAHADDAVLAAIDDETGRPRWWLLDKALHESIHHCAEIGVMRTLFRAQS